MAASKLLLLALLSAAVLVNASGKQDDLVYEILRFLVKNGKILTV